MQSFHLLHCEHEHHRTQWPWILKLYFCPALATISIGLQQYALHYQQPVVVESLPILNISTLFSTGNLSCLSHMCQLCQADREESLLNQRWILNIFYSLTVNFQQWKYRGLLEYTSWFSRKFISYLSLVPTISHSLAQQQCKFLKWQHGQSAYAKHNI